MCVQDAFFFCGHLHTQMYTCWIPLGDVPYEAGAWYPCICCACLAVGIYRVPGYCACLCLASVLLPLSVSVLCLCMRICVRACICAYIGGSDCVHWHGHISRMHNYSIPTHDRLYTHGGMRNTLIHRTLQATAAETDINIPTRQALL